MRWIVDAMNVIGVRPDGWWKDRHGAMVRLTRQLERWAAGQGRQVTVVFEKPPVPPIASDVITIAAAPRSGANSADDEIVRLVRSDDRPQDITVVTSDSALVQRVTTAGAATVAAARFRRLIEEAPGGAAKR
ncbi:RNA-binding protein [Mycolicibacter engbaekii]|uniref:RNA-binding protein n=1 Tax=Mycolicibacter engbaekii TaxID=188915 RepID=A0A1X1TM12_9MYCO|nr:NYN domain-containing protein [Mycolicibacter engbaekii]ORV45590.1 RNA-binding protein [Mycolicibacter engbaekii]